jgi:tetrahydromethanopterin:alpha-L-glutamate ligase
MARPARIALFVDQPEGHARRLVKAFAARGVEALPISLSRCGFRTGRSHGLIMPGFETALPGGAFVRQIAAGSFEQVTMRLGLLHALRELGVRVYNDARVIERCVDKSMTSFLLHRRNIPTPRTWAVESPDEARKVVRAEARAGRPLVLKPLFGSQGRGLRLIGSVDALPPPEEMAGVFYLQRYVAGPAAGWRDWRVFVVGERAVAAMIRYGVEWRTNAAQGARCEGVPATGEIAALAVAAAGAVGAGYAGVDIIADARGRLHVLEINSMPAWKALQQVTRTDIAEALVDDFLSRWPQAPSGRRLTTSPRIAPRAATGR